MPKNKPALDVADGSGRPREARTKLSRRHSRAQLDALARINAARRANAQGSTTRSFSLPDDVLAFIVNEARERKVSRSAVVALAVRSFQRQSKTPSDE